MSIFLWYIFLGLSLAAPIGPVNAALLDKGIKNGFLHAWLVGLGAVIADLIYMLIVYLGVIHLLDIPFIKAFLWSFGFFVLVYTGVEGLIDAKQVSLSQSGYRNKSLSKSFFSGFVISISNPLTILFWLGIYGSVLAQITAKYNSFYVGLYSFAVFLGLLLWDITVASMASVFKKILTTRALMIISIFSGLSLIGFGIYFGFQAIKLILY